MPNKILEVKNLTAAYQKLKVIHGIDLEIEQGEIVALIGSNGAGKSTLMYSLAGCISAFTGGYTHGSISYLNQDISKLHSHQRVALGISLVPEGRRVFAKMTIHENLLLGAFLQDQNNLQASFEYCFDLFPILKERKNQLAATLSGGEQQMLSMARALMNKPKLLLLDEPSMGIAPKLCDLIFEKILQLSETGISVFLVEQNANRALKLASRAYVIDSGKLTFSGKSVDLLNNNMIQEAYLGA